MTQVALQTEPPSPQPATPTGVTLIGKNRAGHWVVQDESGLRGGLFVGRVEALHYAMLENGNRPQAVVMVPGVFELDLHRASRRHVSAAPPLADSDLRRVA